MKYSDQWNLDDEGRLHRAMIAHDKTKSDWTGMPVATTRGQKAADRFSNGMVVIAHLVAATVLGGFALVSLGYIDAPNSKQPTPPAVRAPELPKIGTDICDN